MGTLIDKTMKKANFCAVLDIAGFEIFEYNGFEQISINFVNEKLQQFFNHHMFVVEQEEYVAEGVEWAPVDFGMDLAACIIMFEKPMGVWAILEEESLFPKATDKSFEEKLKAGLGKCGPFAKPQSKTDKNAHFAVIHYAGTVSYNVTGWLEKNKDPVNDTVVDCLKRSANALLVHLWRDHPGQSAPPEEEKGKKKKKGGGAKTVSSVYLVQLAELMGTLHSTEPHFIRCIVPNTHKQPLVVETELIMHQLTCNGVLEGIRVCMLGFPNRMLYPDFKSRYAILGAAEIASSSDNKVAVYALMDKIGFPREKFQLGHTKVFFRAGALAGLEDDRDNIVLKLVRWMQGQCYGYIQRKKYAVKFDQRELMKVIQRNFRKFASLRNWGWFIIIQKTRPLIGQINLEEELRILEEKAKSAYGAYEEALQVTKDLEAANKEIEAEKAALTKQLESEQGNLSVYTDRQTKATKVKAETEGKLDVAQKQLAQAELDKQQMTADRKAMEGDIGIVKKDIEDLELAFQKLEQEKTNRDHTIRSLNDEVAQQDEVINKLNKEKKMVGDTQAKAIEDLHVAEEKVAHLNAIKGKLEATLDELESSLEKEKRGRANVEKERRKVEGELKVTQESVADQERTKKELESSIERKEKDASVLLSKLDDEQSLVAKIQKGIKENQAHVEELEEELEAERQARAKAERQRSDLARELENMGERLGEASGATSAQIELNKKREAEVTKLRRDLEEAHIQQEATLVSLKKKHQDAIAEMTEQIEQLNKMKNKVEKDKTLIMHEISDARAATDEVARSKASSEKSLRNLQNTLNELGKKIEEANLTLGDIEAGKRKLAAENADLLRQLQELENSANMLSKMKISLADQLSEARAVADNEAKERQSLLGKFRNAEHEVAGMKDHFDEEVSAKENLGRQLSKALGEADMLRVKYEKEGLAKAEELEMAKLKMQARLSEAESTADQLQAKLAQVEKARAKISAEIESMAGQLDQAQKETRNASSELFRVKSAYDEAILQLDEVRRENKTLSHEIKDIMDQISEGGRSIHDIDKICKRLEAEKMELEAALSEAEGALEQEENKVLRIQLELTQLKQEIDRRMAEKDEEFAATKKNMAKAIEGMQSAVESESKAKAEALRMKKKLENDVLDLESNLERANAANADTQRVIKNYQHSLREAQSKLEEQQRAKEVAHDELINADRRANSNQNALEESRTLLEQADRARRMVEQELADTNETLSEQTCTNQAIQGAKQKLEAEMSTLQADCDEMASEAALSEEKAQRAMIDAARLADELRAEQDMAQCLERERRLLEAQVKDIQSRVDEAQANALKGGKKAMTRMDTRIRELESELDSESRRSSDAQKNLRKSERKIKELTYQQDEDRKNHERMQALIDQLQGKIKSYKKQIEEAEEIAALNLAKYRKVTGALGDAEASADANEQAMAKLRTRARSSSVAPM